MSANRVNQKMVSFFISSQLSAFSSVSFTHCSRGPTPARSRSATSRLARAAGAADCAPGCISTTAQHDQRARLSVRFIRIPDLGSRILAFRQRRCFLLNRLERRFLLRLHQLDVEAE